MRLSASWPPRDKILHGPEGPGRYVSTQKQARYKGAGSIEDAGNFVCR